FIASFRQLVGAHGTPSIQLRRYCPRRLGLLHNDHAHGSNSCPEDGARTSAQCQCQSSSARHAKDLGNEHISAFIGPEVARVERAHEVDHLGQRFHDESAAYGDSCSHKPQNDVDLQDCQHVPYEIEDQCCPERGRCCITKAQ